MNTVLAPWDFVEATVEARKAQANQQKAEERVRVAYREFAEAEQAYRVLLAQTILQYKNEGLAITACADIARGAGEVAELRKDRDIKEGLKEAAQAALWRHQSNRKDVLHFAEWSQRRELAEGAA